MLLHADAFAHKSFYTQKLFTSVFDVQRPLRAKGLPATPQNRNFTSVFDVQRPFRAKGLRFVALRRHRPRLKREIERRERGDLQM